MTDTELIHILRVEIGRLRGALNQIAESLSDNHSVGEMARAALRLQVRDNKIGDDPWDGAL